MLGSSNSIACANIMLNAAVADVLKGYADALEKAKNFETALHDLIRKSIIDHKRIIFNGNGYDDEWIREATEKRGLLNLRTTPDALPTILEKKNSDMLTSLKIFTPAEIRSRYEITLENYCKTVNIEALTMIDMARKEILPAIVGYVKELSETVGAAKAVAPSAPLGYGSKTVSKLCALADEIDQKTDALEAAADRYKQITDVTAAANDIRDDILQRMAELRVPCDEAETLMPASVWPFPTYGDLLFGVK